MSSCDVPRRLLIQDEDALSIVLKDSFSVRITVSDLGNNLFVNIHFLKGNFLFDTSISPKVILENGTIKNVNNIEFTPNAPVIGGYKKIFSPSKAAMIFKLEEITKGRKLIYFGRSLLCNNDPVISDTLSITIEQKNVKE